MEPDHYHTIKQWAQEVAVKQAAPPPKTIRRVVPRAVPAQFPRHTLVRPVLGLPMDPFPFCKDPDGVSFQDIFKSVSEPAHLESLGLQAYYKYQIMLETQPCLFHISWPGYRQYVPMWFILKHDGTVGSIAIAIAQAYRTYFLNAREWKFEPNETDGDESWKITGDGEPHHLQYMRLHSLSWVDEDFYQADVSLIVPVSQVSVR